MKTVYTCFCTDVIHEGHHNILNEAKKLGRVVVGILKLAGQSARAYGQWLSANLLG